MHLIPRLALFVSLLVIFSSQVQAFSVLGLGNAALVGDDLTDRSNDGVEGNYAPPADFGGFDAEFFASSNPAFNAGESAFNVFDNLTGGSVNKWCCGPASNSVTARILAGPHILTAFTITSSNDTPLRDPRVWEVQGSNDGVSYTTIFRQDNISASVWGNERNEVIQFSAADGDAFLVMDQAFSYFRLATHVTGGGEFALGEVEFFGVPNLPPVISDLAGDQLSYTPLAGALVVDQGAPASVDDPLAAVNGWSNGTLRVTISLGGVPVEDKLTVMGGTSIGVLSGGTNGSPLEVVFNDTATSASVGSLLQAIAYENLSDTPTPSTRIAEFLLTDGDGGTGVVVVATIDINTGGVNDLYVWDGGGDGTSFTEPANWEGDSGFPDANDTAIFRSNTGNGSGTINLGGERYVGPVIFDGASSFNLMNGPLATDELHQQASATGTNTVSAQMVSASFTGTVDGATLNPLNPQNFGSLQGGSWTINGGGSLVKTGGGSLGNTALNLGGGSLVLALDVSTVMGRFVQVVNNGAGTRALHIGELEVFAPGSNPAVDHAAGAGSLNPTNDLATTANGASVFDKSAASGFVSDHGGDDDGRLLDAAETVGGDTFGITGNGAFVTVDLGGVKDLEKIRVHQRNDGCCQNRLMNFTVNILADNGGSPGSILATGVYPAQPSNDGFAELLPSAGGVINNAITVSADSTIVMESAASGIFSDLLVTTDVRLDVVAAGGESLAFLGDATFAGTATFTQTGMPIVVLNNVTGPGGLILDGDGTLQLPTANAYAGETIIRNGLLVAGDGMSFGSAASGTVVEDGGGIQVSGGTFPEPLTLNGFGNALLDGALNKVPLLNVVWTGPITAGSATRIYSAGNVTFLDGGINLDPGASLTIDAQNQVQIRNNEITGDASTLLRFEGNDRTSLVFSNPNFLGDIEVFSDGRLELFVDGALGDNAGLTSLLGGECSLVLRDGRTQVENLVLEGDGRGTEGAIRNENNNNTIRGTVLLDGDTEIVTRLDSSLTIDGPVIGATQLTQRETGVLVLTQDSAITNYNLVGGTVRMETRNGLGSTTELTLDTGEALELAQSLQLDAVSNLTQLNANGGTVSSFSGTCTLDLPINANTNQAFRFGGDGNLVLAQSIGHGAGISTNDLVKTGAGHLIPQLVNTYNGDTFVLGGTLEVSGSDTLGLPGGSLTVDATGTLLLMGNINLVRDVVNLHGIGAADQLGALVSMGDNLLTATQFQALLVNLGEVRLVSTTGRFMLDGPIDLRASRLSVDGSGDINLLGAIAGLGGDFVPNARFVQVQKNIPGLLHIGELEVFAPGTGAVNGNVGGNNAPLNNPADLAVSPAASVFSASVAGGHGVPAAVIDGQEQTAGTTWTKMESGGEVTAQITIDLGGAFDIDSVRVHQRNDTCCQDRLENFTVNLFADAGGSPGTLVASEVFPGRPPLNSFGELFFSKFTDNHLTKRGSGTLTLASTNTYNGGSSILDGTLLANGASAAGTQPVGVEQGGVLSGTGTILADVTIGTLGTVSPGLSPGVLTLSSNLVFSDFSSVYQAEFISALATDIDRLDVTGDIDLNDATLELVRDAAYDPAVNDVIRIATSVGNINGTFNGLPEGAVLSAQGEAFTISYTGGEITLTATGGQRVYAGPDIITRVPTNSVTVDVSVLLANDLIGSGAGPLELTSVLSTGVNGGTLSLATNLLTYTAPAAYEGDDRFTYIVSDGTHSATGLVTVLAVSLPSAEPPVGKVSGLAYLLNGDYRVAFTGTPGASYEIQWTQDITTTPIVWQVLGSVVADTSGNILIDHATPPDGAVYYRSGLE
ncbi:MAG: autotransporter-associated beta strand protein [Verrucomicrobiales bacterium]|jgi:autotransporter-associated beta strand protein